MYRQNAAPPPPDPREVARQSVKNCATIQLAIAAMNTISIALVLMRLWFFKLPPNANIPLDVQHEARVYTLAGLIAYIVIFAAWAGLNAWGLGKRSKAARWSSMAFSVAIMATCCATPFGGFLLYLLLKKDVKAYFD